jgi:rhodanese-related sulfurtransferase
VISRVDAKTDRIGEACHSAIGAAFIPPVVDHDHLAQLLATRHDIRLLDVRSPAEFQSIHIPGSYHVPLDTLGEHATEIRAGVDSPIVLVCQSGVRARRADDILRSAGLPQLHVLDGGINAWLAAGNEVVRGRTHVSLERQVRITAGALAAVGGILAVTVHPLFAAIPVFVGSGLVFAGATDTCAMGMALARLPWNRVPSCDVGLAVRTLTGNTPAAR